MPNNGPASSSVPRNSARDIQPSRGSPSLLAFFFITWKPGALRHLIPQQNHAAPHLDTPVHARSGGCKLLFNKPIREALRNRLSHCHMHHALLKRRTPFGIAGLGIAGLEPPPLHEPLSEPCLDVFRATPLCAPPNLGRTIGISVIPFALHCAAPYE